MTTARGHNTGTTCSRHFLSFLIFSGLFAPGLNAQTNPDLNVNLLIDCASAEQTMALIDGEFVNTETLARLRGNRIAASTTGLIANQMEIALLLQSYLDSVKSRQRLGTDIYNLEAAEKNARQIKELLTEIKKRNFSRRVAATVEQIFPPNAVVNLTIPVYVVSLGHENVDAYVRRIDWHGDVPGFVGEKSGELTIVINLAQSVGLGPDLEERFISLLCIVAHEVFHAAFSAYKENSPSWKAYYSKYNRPVDELIDLTMNEGIAYYLTLDQRGRGYLPPGWNSRVRTSFRQFNESARELSAADLTRERAYELIRSANLSGYWESYGSITGMFIAREIDMTLGRKALIGTISSDPNSFIKKYSELAGQNSNLPALDQEILKVISER